MIKHESQKNNENMTGRNTPLNNLRYDSARIASEKSRMKTLDSKKETDVNSRDVIRYNGTVYHPIEQKPSASSTGSRFTQTKTMSKTDLEKHIDESERYYIDMTNGHQKNRETQPSGQKFKRPVPTTTEISAFEPKNMTFPSEESMDTVTFRKKETKEEAAVDQTQTTVAKSVRTDVTEQTRAFGSFASAKNDASEKTVDISSVGVMTAEKPLPVQQEIPPEEKEPLDFEYTSPEQNKQIFEEMHSKHILSIVRIAMAAVLAAALFAIENIPIVKSLFDNHLVYIVVDWLLAFVCAVLVFDRLCRAFQFLFKLKPDADSITLISFFFSFAATALVLLFEMPENEITLYNFPFALCVLFNTLFVYFSLRRDKNSFSVISTPCVKRSIVLNDPAERPSSLENTTEKEGDMGNKYGQMKEVNFIEDYYAHKAEMPSAKNPLRVILPFCFGISFVFFICALLVMKHTPAESMTVAYATFMMCAPFSAFLAYSFPMYLASRRTKDCNSAILCDKTPDTYRDVSMIVFRDTEVFSSGKAKVKSIRLYADKKIDNAIYYASSIYSVIGGPLADVFKKAALNSVSSENVEIREVCADGVCAMIDGRHIAIGTPSYMDEQCFETVNDPGDEEYEGKTNKRIIYLACDQIVIAKFYIQYIVGSDFLELASGLFAEGIGIGIATADPCLDIGIFYENQIDPEQHAIRVLKGRLEEPAEESVSAKKAGVVSYGTTKNLVKAILLCGKLENVKKTHLVLKTVSAILGVAVMALILFTGKAPEMLSVYPALYQIFWMLPTYFISKVYL